MFKQLPGRRHAFALFALFLCASTSYAQTATGPENVAAQREKLCQTLFQLITSGSKRPMGITVDVAAVENLLGDNPHFWRPVLAEFRKDNRHTRQCIRILGLMLGVDATERDVINRGVVTQEGFPTVCLPSTVVPELMARARKQEAHLDTYLVALARARDSRCRDLFLSVLNDTKYGLDNSKQRFHAAVGLANIDDPAGVEWMIAHCEDYAADIETATACVLALRSISGRYATKKADFEDWWKTAPKPFKLDNPIELR